MSISSFGDLSAVQVDSIYYDNNAFLPSTEKCTMRNYINNQGRAFKFIINPWGVSDMIKKSEVRRRILNIVAYLSQNDVKKDVLETEIISHSGLPAVLSMIATKKLTNHKFNN
jgi:hypothetical protein